MDPQPLLTVRNVPVSSLWYQAVLGFRSGHGGGDYDQLMIGDRIVLQLQSWDPAMHRHLGDPELVPYGNGVALWFLAPDFDEAVRRIRGNRVDLIEGPKVNTKARRREIWLRDPDGYIVVLASRPGDVKLRTEAP